jgi:Fur family transcriptional regulator, ferric uptake regulator
VTGSELVDRCRAIDPATTPSTVYRTLRVLEELGVVRHAHGADGREEFHVRPAADHGHLHCAHCGASWEIASDDAAATVASFQDRWGFEVDLSHLTVVGRCASCRSGEAG